ncbi:MAG: ThiF family adenylyltransferase [Pirellulales bacterium]|nr:ThiF family adenylyltransferase [Pirellulales bacterium]
MTDDASSRDGTGPAGRYARQIRFAPLGETGQEALMGGRVLICGCGALGSVVADTLVRAGAGFVRIVDRDFVELNNLHRQVLFDEADASARLPKAVAAVDRLRDVNSSVVLEAEVADLRAENIHRLAADVDLLIDGTDNFETRYLLNDFSVAQNIPWIFAGCVGAEGQTFAILPGETPCLSCFLPEPPPSAALPTCDTAGVLEPIVSVLASLQAMEAIKILSGNQAQLNSDLTFVNLWENSFRSIGMVSGRREDCLTCGQRQFVWLRGERCAAVTQLCGSSSIQILPTSDESLNLVALAEKLRTLGAVTSNPFLVRLEVDDHVLTIFADGRTIIGGTDDPAVARTLVAKYLG